MDNVSRLLKERKIKLEVTPAAKDAIIAEGYDPQFGARPMRRAIQRLVQDPLALKLLNGEFAGRRHYRGGRRRQGPLNCCSRKQTSRSLVTN